MLFVLWANVKDVNIDFRPFILHQLISQASRKTAYIAFNNIILVIAYGLVLDAVVKNLEPLFPRGY